MLDLIRNAADFGRMLLDEFLGWLASEPVEVTDGVGPWTSTIDLDAVADAL